MCSHGIHSIYFQFLSKSFFPSLSLSLNAHQGAFPARLKKVLIVGAPVWFRVPYNLLSLLLKEKLRERVSAPTPASDWPSAATANRKEADCSWDWKLKVKPRGSELMWSRQMAAFLNQ